MVSNVDELLCIWDNAGRIKNKEKLDNKNICPNSNISKTNST
jgi:hypothetical protein